VVSESLTTGMPYVSEDWGGSSPILFLSKEKGLLKRRSSFLELVSRTTREHDCLSHLMKFGWKNAPVLGPNWIF
jgi:hypothetical protein